MFFAAKMALVSSVVLIGAASVYALVSAEDDAALAAAANAMTVYDLPTEQVRGLRKLSESKDAETAARAARLLSVWYRQEGNYAEAMRSVEKYATPAGLDRLTAAEAAAYLRCLLEVAHLRALQGDIPGALKLLNWAESRPDDYQRALACVKYAEILLNLNEAERAESYLATLDEIVARRTAAAAEGAAIGQGSEVVDTSGAWTALQTEAREMQSEAEVGKLRQKFGGDYAGYAKLRKLQQAYHRSREPRYYRRALRLAEELMTQAPGTQFATAAEYVIAELQTAQLTEDSSREEIAAAKKYLDRFLKSDPAGLYRGEALMLRGRIALEIEWNVRDAEKYYTQALQYFRAAREQRDALSLYAPMSDDLKRQTEPDQKPTSLNEFYRIVYHEEDPLKLYNTAAAPSWYIDDKEKNCLFILGFIHFSLGDMKAAEQYWSEVIQCYFDFNNIDPRLPNLISRLKASLAVGYMVFTPLEKKNIKNVNLLLRLQYAEFLYIQERFDDAIRQYERLFVLAGDNMELQAIVMTGIGGAHEVNFQKEGALESFQWVLSRAEDLNRTPIYYGAVCRYADSIAGTYNGLSEAIRYYDIYLEKYPYPSPEGRYFRVAQYRRINALIINNEIARAKREFAAFDCTIKDGYPEELNRMFKVVEKYGHYEGGVE